MASMSESAMDASNVAYASSIRISTNLNGGTYENGNAYGEPPLGPTVAFLHYIEFTFKYLDLEIRRVGISFLKPALYESKDSHPCPS
jgi:hypothetical protein